MFNACRSFRGIDLHPAHGIVLFSLLHLLIVTPLTHFYLYLSAQGAGLLKLSMNEPEFPAMALWFGVVKVLP
jgi:hypothetical protein